MDNFSSELQSDSLVIYTKIKQIMIIINSGLGMSLIFMYICRYEIMVKYFRNSYTFICVKLDQDKIQVNFVNITYLVFIRIYMLLDFLLIILNFYFYLDLPQSLLQHSKAGCKLKKFCSIFYRIELFSSSPLMI